MKIIFYLLLFLSQLVLAVEERPQIKPDEAELQLLLIIELVKQQKTDLAIGKTEALLSTHPDFKLAKILHYDLLHSKHTRLDTLVGFNEKIAERHDYFSEVSARLNSKDISYPQNNVLPQRIKYISAEINYFFVFDFSKSRLYLFENKKDSLKLLADHYVTIGKNGTNKQLKGDERTPVGVYRIKSFLTDQQLPELYGWGAFPINYPNSWDKKRNRTGSGIWLHGVPRNTYSRPPNDSKGCLVISNSFLSNVAPYVKANTPVILADQFTWLEQIDFHKNNLYHDLFKQWIQSWQNKSLKKYLSFYSKNFDNNDKNYTQWAKHKSRIFRQTKSINITVSHLSIVEYPGEENLISVSFIQYYQGDNYKNTGYKQQFWKKEADNQWRIIYEMIEN